MRTRRKKELTGDEADGEGGGEDAMAVGATQKARNGRRRQQDEDDRWAVRSGMELKGRPLSAVHSGDGRGTCFQQFSPTLF